MITKVRLRNWRSHADSELVFSPGTNALVGILGSGKTSILDAICFALFGTFPTLQNRKLKIEDIIMKKPERKDRAEVEVEFELDGSQYSAKRTIERGVGTTYSEIKRGSVVLESPSTQRVTETIEKILKVNYDLFSKAIYAEQNNIDYFLTLGKGQRMKKIDELLMIEKFDKARASAVTLTNKIAERMVGKESMLQQSDADGLVIAAEKTESEILQSTEARKELEMELEEVKKRKAELESEVSELRKIYEGLQSLKRQESGINSAIEETEKIIDDLKSAVTDVDRAQLPMMLQQISDRVDELNETLKAEQMEYEDLQSRLTESKSKIEFLRKEKIEKLEKEIEAKLELKKEFEHLRDTTGENIDEQVAEKDRMHNELVTEAAELKAKISNLQDVLVTLSAAEGKCPVCDSDLSDERRKLLTEKKEMELEQLKGKIDEVKERKQMTEEEIEKIKLAAEKMKELLAEIKDFDRMKTELESSKQLFRKDSATAVELDNQLSEIKKAVETMRVELEKAKDERQRVQLAQAKMKDYQNRETRLKELENERKELKQHLTKHEEKMKGQELDKLESWLKNAMVKEREIEIRIAGMDEMMKEKESRIREHRVALQQIERDRSEIARLARLVRELKIFTEALKQTQSQLRENFVTAVNMRMSELWQTLYPYQDFAGVRLAVEEGDYVLQLQEKSGTWVNVEGVASGGERSIACLALRIAFALVLAPQLPMLVLDEPTANLDVRAVEDLARTLRESMPNLVDQVFIITHDEKLEEAVTGSLYRLERDKAADESTKVFSISS